MDKELKAQCAHLQHYVVKCRALHNSFLEICKDPKLLDDEETKKVYGEFKEDWDRDLGNLILTKYFYARHVLDLAQLFQKSEFSLGKYLKFELSFDYWVTPYPDFVLKISDQTMYSQLEEICEEDYESVSSFLNSGFISILDTLCYTTSFTSIKNIIENYGRVYDTDKKKYVICPSYQWHEKEQQERLNTAYKTLLHYCNNEKFTKAVDVLFKTWFDQMLEQQPVKEENEDLGLFGCEL